MSDARLTSEVIDAEFVDVAERQRDRWREDRRAAAPELDTLFAATLVNHVMKTDEQHSGGYAATPKLRAGVVVNLQA